ncbi:MAG: hypothetical protein OEO79_07540 [Gemmatimonadota bacterium]|nr:hypothetical protein [Gemmatimonadota bacterium]MDH3422301.1 hypothetical protein [Gemmatimonadota bacterium]
MEHLTAEALARLVDDEPQPDEQAHLDACEACTTELAAFREQTDALSTLPEIVPPLGDWEVIEAHLRSEGLVRDRALLSKLGLARTPSWMPAAAAAVLFLGGVATGAGVVTRDGDLAVDATSVEAAASAVRDAEQRYVTAVSNYRTLLSADGVDDNGVDPISRYAALEHLVSVSQAAVRQAPGDPFLNGFLASALAERDAAARVVSLADDNWF